MSNKYLIIGIGQFGFYLAKKLYEMGEEVIAIDKNEKAIRDVRPYCSKAIIGDVTEKKVLEDLDPSDMDAIIIGIGNSIDSSILAVQYLQDLGVEKERIFAKAVSEEHKKLLEKIGVNKVIFPEREAAENMVFMIKERKIVEESFSLGEDAQILEIAAPKSFVGKRLEELDLINKYSIVVVGVKDSLTEKVICPPSKDYLIKDSDALIIAGNEKNLKRIMKEK